MIPAKIFLQAVRAPPEIACRLRFAIVLNALYYDQLKLFQPKYLCLTSQDHLVLEIHTHDSHELLASATINVPYKLVVERKTLELNFPADQLLTAPITLVLSLEPVAAFARKYVEMNTKRLDQVFHQEANDGPLEISFRQREQSQTDNFGIMEKSGRMGQLLATGPLEEGQSLESLAQQREKILGQLFGKFKRDR